MRTEAAAAPVMESLAVSWTAPASNDAARGAYASLTGGFPSEAARRRARCLAMMPGPRLLAAYLLLSAGVSLLATRGSKAVLWVTGGRSMASAGARNSSTAVQPVSLVAGLRGCVGRGENCYSSGCCTEPGMACYKKVDGWAMCRPFCHPGPDPVDTTFSPWSCERIGQHSPGAVPMDFWGGLKPADWVPEKCSEIGENCRESRCCKDAGMTCFAKNERWASCKPQCTPGFDITDIKPDPWACTPLGNPTPGPPSPFYSIALKAGPWVADRCAGSGENCLESICCKQPGTLCFKKNDRWAGCRDTCEAGPYIRDVDAEPWNCTALGPRTPGVPPTRAPLAEWVPSKCVDAGGGCNEMRCCRGAGMQCYEKNAGWAVCMHDCAPGVHRDDPQKTPWSCKALGSRTPTVTAGPTLYCWALSRSSGEEAKLIKYQKANHLSLFGCDEWSVFSDWAFDLGGGNVATPIGDLTAQKGRWGSWLNTKVFVKAWHSIFWAGTFRDYDWTIKIDPDATFFPDRLRKHVADLPAHEPWCIHNSRTSTPMLGPIEVLSRGAMFVYLLNNDPNVSGTDKSVCENPYMGSSGEDGFISGCLKRLGVKSRYDAKVLKQDKESCGDGVYVAYHPFKTVETYEHCKRQAIR